MTATAYVAPSHWLSAKNAQKYHDPFPIPTTLPAQVEVAVIGGGVMGVSTAYWLAQSGVDVLLIEANELAWGASGRNAGLMLAGSQPLEDPALVRAVLQEEQIDAEYMTPGHLALASSEAIWEKITQEAHRRQQTALPVYAIDHGACEDLLGMRIHHRFLGGRWLPQGGLIHPVRLIHGLAQAALRYGAALTTQTRVLSVQPAPGCDKLALQTTRGRLLARQVVFACHTGLAQFVPAFQKLITPVRGQVMATQPLPRLFGIGLAVDWGTVYWRQTIDGVIILGGYRSLDPATETTEQIGTNPQIQQALERFLPDAFPDFPPFRVNQCWAGIMDYAPDGRPLIGALPHHPNQWLIAGFGGHGLPLGLGAGKALVTAMTTGEASPVLAPFDPKRFAAQLLCDKPLYT